MLTSKSFAISNFIILATVILVTEPSLNSIHRGYLSAYESNILEPIFYVGTASFISVLLLLPFSQTLFQEWFSRIFRWFIPLTAVTLLFAGGNPYASISRVDMALACGTGLLVVTIGFIGFRLIKKQS